MDVSVPGGGNSELQGRNSAAGGYEVMAWSTLVSVTGLALARLLDPNPAVISDPRPLTGLLFFCLIGGSAANLCYFKALQLAPLSVAMPVLSLSPVFMTLTSWWMLGERATAAGLAGIFVILAGTCLIYLGNREPPESGTSSKLGFVFALATSAIWSVTSNLDKQAVRLADPILYPLLLQTLFLPVFFYVARRTSPGGKLRLSLPSPAWPWIIAAGLCEVVLIVAQMTAILQTHVAYVIAVKRAGAVLAVILGWKVLGETNISRRLTGALLIASGVAVLLL